MTAGSAPNRPPDGPRIALRLLETTDLHGHIHGYDYYTDRPSDAVGLARLTSLIDIARAEAANCLLFDNGDFLQGTALTEYWGREHGLAAGETHPMIAAMNAVGYDAGTPGNHEFNYGLEFMLRALAGASFPMVCANAITERSPEPLRDRTLLPPWVVLTRQMRDTAGTEHMLRIGVIGLLPPQITAWDRQHLEGRLVTRGIVEAARAHVPALHAAGADLVVALAHTGISACEEDAEHAALALARVPGIDVLLCGHSHLPFPGPETRPAPGIDPARGTLHGKPAMLAGRWGSHLGVMDLQLQRCCDGWRIADFATELRPIRPPAGAPRPPEAPRIIATNTTAHAKTLEFARRPLGHSAVALHSYVAPVAPDRALTLVAQAQRDHVRRCLGDDLPILSAVSPFKCGGRSGPEHFLDIPPGPLTTRHIVDLYLFPNTISAIEITGAGLADWLERAAGLFHRLSPGVQDQPLLNPEFPCYNFDVILGLTYQIDLSQPARHALDGRLVNPQARRIGELCHKGRPVAPDDRFILATNNYRSSGAGGFVAEGASVLDLGPPVSAQDALMQTVQSVPAVAPQATPIWRFASMPDTSALYCTAPCAARFLPLPNGPHMEALGIRDDGFLELRLFFQE
ncbi:bifunctional 2',3'-cyclic-nucleotide 2'-phosphodiesterase/3'-nucleotidase [Sedimentimonas flavescens]|uniref:bifunctional 2',3'-cyclic-nucleotide 2'-phosphodiesterase/3'-nucleotidase n=1 Tax=Sedimentimonas flavescens TaxID=2851012 RepID=UPI001C4A2A5D|nr:bifunctional 2',3'-cyclic-nucleotide 2'-phosphodiesterase/3'-nucleotidase [Sedimentimonas flavescens]MBW0156959.1 bifunctional 2',3'-cyclic-nucleotide 2'-phosphodiesterase/3'-nucleotidase [Sedimentimonas flavescens]